ncbi:DUF5362 family protein [Mucilaginibacter segetis]|uniref:DUF5362 domain-containing protein n=1 Tax=Mucilaginibacter segetis TaxID=2793071 RepID=A0A934PWK2_9SPHI|nr:DUF5362 family protein [Mucilaginibacter segetis]MBK0380837.1 hypothetical protein [Mucilaginibacter segetis]
MEINEEFTQPEAEKGMLLTNESQYYLQQAGKWANFLGIVGFVMTGFILLLSLFIGAIFSKMGSMPNSGMPYGAGMGGFMTVFYILIAIFNFFFSLYLYQFGSRIKDGISYNDAEKANSAFVKLKSFFKLWGITTIVIIILYALFFITMLIGGLGLAALMGH